MNTRSAISMVGPKPQRGFLLIVSVVLIVIAALLLTVMVYLGVTGNESSVGHSQSGQALFIAGSGAEAERRRLAQNVDWYRSTTDPFVAAPQNLGAGGFTVYTNLPATMLRRRIPSATSVANICVYTVDRFPTTGTIQVEDDMNSSAEFIRYTGISSSDASCGNRPAFTGIVLANRNYPVGGVSNVAGDHERNSYVYPVTTLLDNLAASVTCVAPVQLRLTDHPKFLTAGTISLDDGGGVNAEEISYASATRAGGVLTLRSLRRLNGSNCPAWLIGAPATPLLDDGASPDFEAQVFSSGTVDNTLRQESRTVQR